MANQIPAIMDRIEPLVFFYDYADPASYLLELWLKEDGLVPGSGLLPLPFEMNPPPDPLLDPADGPFAVRWEHAEREASTLGLKLKRPSIVPWTRKAHELAFHAADLDCVAEIHEALFRAYLIEGRDIGRVDVLTALARELGLDPSRAKAALDVDKHTGPLKDIRAKALREGVAQPPTLLRNQRFLRGPQTQDTLRNFLGGGSKTDKP